MNIDVDPTTLEHAAKAAYRAALRAGLTDVDARDLAQEALVRALTSARPPAGVALPAWVYGIAKNLGRDHHRSAQRREIVVEDASIGAFANDDLATALAVRRAVAELPDPLRDVITLHALEGMSLRETAEVLQIPFDTAKDRLRRAREQLRATFGDDLPRPIEIERAHTRRCAIAQAGVIVAGIYAMLHDRSIAAAAGPEAGRTSVGTAITSTARTARVVPLWFASVAGSVLLAGGFAAGRITASAPSRPSARAPVVAPPLDETPSPVEIASAPEPAPVAPVRAAAPDPAPQLAARPQRAPSAPAQVSPTVPDPGNPEQLLLDRARAGLRRGMHDEALVTLMEHARRFPDGALSEDRDVLMIEAYLRSGNAMLARRRITEYRRAHPDGVLRGRVAELEKQLQP